MKEKIRGIKNVIINSNVVISSLIKRGVSRYILFLLISSDFSVFAPSELMEELKDHLEEISEKSGASLTLLKRSFSILRRALNIEDLNKNQISEGRKYVKDDDDALLLL